MTKEIFRMKSTIRHRKTRDKNQPSLNKLLKFVTITVLALAFSLLSTNNAIARTLRVPNQYLSIQDAVNASNPGDIIVVASGLHKLFTKNITIKNMSLTLMSEAGPEKTIIQGRGDSPVITLVRYSQAVIDGFTITSIKDEDSVPLEGGGIHCAPSSAPTIVNNIITGNHAVLGAGIYCAPRSAPTIANNVISKNKAVNFGGGIFSFKSSPNIANNTIAENEASSSGGGIFCQRDVPRITNNVIWKNKSKVGGGYSGDRSFSAITNNTIVENEAAYGGGIYFSGGAVRMVNLILWKNSDDLHAERFTAATRPDHSNIGDGDFRGVKGNISADPLFVDPENGNFRLMPESPCINTGNLNQVYDDPDGSRSDMGAFGGPKANLGVSPRPREAL
jgi:parallel beta-helix repeat protein